MAPTAPKASSGGRVGIGAAAVAALAVSFVTLHEGIVTRTYADPVGIPTVCAGETGPHVRYGQTYTVSQCMAMLDKRLQSTWRGVERCISVTLEPHQAMAILSFAYNVGITAACRSTLIALLNRGEPAAVWCAQLSRWIYANGRKLPGLVTRRAAEREICERGSNGGR